MSRKIGARLTGKTRVDGHSSGSVNPAACRDT